MVNYGYIAGMKAIKKQILPSITKTKHRGKTVEEYTHDLLARTCPGWIKGEES